MSLKLPKEKMNIFRFISQNDDNCSKKLKICEESVAVILLHPLLILVEPQKTIKLRNEKKKKLKIFYVSPKRWCACVDKVR